MVSSNWYFLAKLNKFMEFILLLKIIESLYSIRMTLYKLSNYFLMVHSLARFLRASDPWSRTGREQGKPIETTKQGWWKKRKKVVSSVSNEITVVGHRINVLTTRNAIQTSIGSLILSTIFEMERLRLMNWQVKLYYRPNQIFQFERED